MKRILSLLLACCLLLCVLSGCNVPVESLTLSAAELSIKVGMSKEITATVTQSASNKNLEWISSDPEVAIVAIKGTATGTAVVTAVKPGTATITAKTRDGSGIVASCQVTVEEGSGILAELDQAEVLGTLTATKEADPDGLISKAKCIFYTDGTYMVDAYYAETALHLQFEGTYKIENGQLIFNESAIATIVVVFVDVWEQETQALPKVVDMGDFLRINIGVTEGDQPQAANFDIDKETQALMGLTGDGPVDPTDPTDPVDPTDPPAPPADEPADVGTILGSTYFENQITFSINHALLGYIGYIFQPDGSMQANVFGQISDYGRYGIVTEDGKQYVLATETKFIENGQVLPSNVTKWTLTEVDGVKALDIPDIGVVTEETETSVEIATIVGTTYFTEEIKFGTEDNTSIFIFKTDGTVGGEGVAAGYSHYGIVEKDGKTYVAMLQASAVADGKALASKVELYELTGEGAAQTITYLFLGIPIPLTVK